jgi:hypothetical protein
MIIEKSPFYSKNQPLKEVNIEKNLLEDKDIGVNEDFSFWGWFKGLVNPLQNLPLISGIYSSVNSDEKESDRDLVQNSLGGFLYGGPIGAIAGFGNWVFNKIFEKTPTELVLDASGVSNIWKSEDDKNNIKTETASINDQLNENKKLYIQYAFSNSLNNEKISLPIQSKTTLNKKFEKIPTAPDINITGKIIEKENFINLDKKKVDVAPDVNITKKIIEKEKLINLDKKTLDNIKTNDEKFREINFSYPQWKPDANKKIEEKTNLLRDKYQELGKIEISNRLKINA